MSDVAPGGVNLAVDPDVAPYVAQGTDPPRSLWPQFAHRKPGGEAISAHGAQVAGCADEIDEVNQSAESLHARARSQVHGDPAGPMAAATHDVTRRADLLQRRAVVAGGAITEFGQAVSEFNQLVDGWNAQIQCAADYQAALAIYQEHLPTYRRADILHEAEHAAMSRLTNWDDDATVKDLWQTGALPITVVPLFPGLNLKLDDLDNVDALDMLVKLGHTLLLTNIRSPMGAIAEFGAFTSRQASRLPLSLAARKDIDEIRRGFRTAEKTLHGTNWSRWGTLGAIGKHLPWLDASLTSAQAIQEFSDGDYGWGTYHFIESTAAYAATRPSSAMPFAALLAGGMALGELAYDHRAKIADAAQEVATERFERQPEPLQDAEQNAWDWTRQTAAPHISDAAKYAWNNPERVAAINPTAAGGFYAAKGVTGAAEWTWDKATQLWPFSD